MKTRLNLKGIIILLNALLVCIFLLIYTSCKKDDEEVKKAPKAPSGLMASAVSSSQINITWSDQSNDETGFKLERSPNGSTGWFEIATTAANATSYQNTGLAASTAYYYRVRAFNSTGTSTYSNTVNATTQAAATPPAAPSNLTTTAASSSQINLSWTDNSGNETGYKIERSPNGSSNWTEIHITSANITSYQNTGLTASTAYYYRVRSFNANGNSTYSNTANATTQAAATPPAAPSNLTATAASSSQINLSWTDNSSNETGFKIERSPNGSSSWTEIHTTAANVNSYQNTGLSASTAYYYRVRSYNANGNSAYSNTANATTHAAATPPAAPSNLTATAASSSQINLSWTDNSGNETGFKIERSPNGSSSWTEIHTTAANANSYQNTGLSASTTYYYRVRSYNANGNSAYSNTANATTQAAATPPAAPTNLTATANSPTSVNLSWTDNSTNETGFEIQRQHTSINTWITVTTVGANVNTYSHGSLNETWPRYRVRAVNSTGNSSFSNEAFPPPKLRVINNLYNQVGSIDWGKLNNIVRVRIGPTQSSVEAAGNSYERLAPYESVTNIANANWIPPSYTSANQYADFPLSTYSGIGSTYYLYLQCGWWEYFIPGVGSAYWIKRVSEVLCSNGQCCCYKWAWVQITNHSAGYIVVTATQIGLPHGNWNNTTKSANEGNTINANSPPY